MCGAIHRSDSAMSEEDHSGHTGTGERLIKERRSGKNRRKGANAWNIAPDTGKRNKE